ncbi:MAG: ester cyclase [Candidatus Bathyarchaeota archaeon]|nr:MAG: ester cyclase [Candidatus Bathyarchaeota archaeon]
MAYGSDILGPLALSLWLFSFQVRFIEAYNQQNLDSLDEFVAQDYVDHTNQIRGLESLKQLMTMGIKAVPDWHETIEDIIAEGDKVWVRLAYTGTHTGEGVGLIPTGNKITAMAVDIYRIVNGKLAEYWNVTDRLALLKPQGVIEYTEKGKKLFPEDAK